MNENPELASTRERWCEANLKKWSRDQAGPWGSALCPLHEDSKSSLRVNLDTGGWICHGACQTTGVMIDLAKQANLNPSGLPVLESKSKPGRPAMQPVAEYIYRDLHGNPVMRVCRYFPKDFRQFRRENGNWVPGLSGTTPRLPYRLDEINNLHPRIGILWVEGEKDADAAWALNIPATTSPQGSNSLSKIQDQDLAIFKCRKIYVIPDNDQAGRNYAEMVAERLHNIGNRCVFMVHLNGVPDKGDLSDWLAMHDQDKFERIKDLLNASKLWICKRKLDTILVGDRELHDISEQAIRSLLAWNNPPQLFHDRSGQIISLETVAGEPKIKAVCADAMRGLLSESARWRKPRKADEVCIYPDQAVAREIVLRKACQLPYLDQIVRVPVFDANLRLVSAQGYHEPSSLYLDMADLKVPDIPSRPTASQVADAKGVFFGDLLVDFPFVDDASRCHALCIILLPFVRRLTGPTPLHLIESPQVSNGKSLLASILTIPATGKSASVMSDAGDDESEWRKRLQSSLRAMPTYILIDNVGTGIESDVLAAVLTANTYEDRELGTSHNLTLANRSTWIATGNNLHLKLDIARRTLWIRIDSKEAKPWTRSGFKHPHLVTWALENRNLLVWAALTLCQHWIAEGCPRYTGPCMGSFESHNQVMGGICAACGITGFLANYEEQFIRSDSTSAEWEAFLTAWWEHPSLSTTPCSCKHLAELLEEKQLLESVIKSASAHGRRAQLGRKLQGQIDRIYGDLVIRLHAEKGPGGLRTYRIEKIYQPSPVSTVPPVIPEMIF